MAILPRKPQQGEKVLQSLYDTVCNIIDFLPSLQIRGDNKTIRVNSFGTGKTIEAIPKSSPAAGAPASGGPVYIDEGAAVPATIQSQPNAWGLPYNVNLYPDGYGGSSTGAEYALPTSISFSDIPPNGAKIIVFKAYINALGGDEEFNGDTE